MKNRQLKRIVRWCWFGAGVLTALLVAFMVNGWEPQADEMVDAPVIIQDSDGTIYFNMVAQTDGTEVQAPVGN